jgi:ferredoxin
LGTLSVAVAHRTGKSGYRRLSGRLNKFPQGAPPGDLLFRIFSLLFTEQEAALLAQLPLRPFTAEAAARAWKLPATEARRLLDGFAARALLLDGEHEGERLYVFPPPMAGFFEFSMMRARPETETKVLAELLYRYINVEDEFVTDLFGAGETQFGRALVSEPALAAYLGGNGDGPASGNGDRPASGDGDGVVAWRGDGSPAGDGDGPDGEGTADSLAVLDYERASALIGAAHTRGVSACFCRHKLLHVGTACDAPLDICMSFDFAADSLIRHGHARAVETAEALDLLERAQEANLLQFAENVRLSPKFLCHCCSCCCEALLAARRFGFLHPVHTTGFIPVQTEERCRACGRCADVCPVDAITVHKDAAPPHAVIDEEQCLGCGICTRVCAYDALKLARRPERVITPVNSAHRVVVQAIETDTLPYLVFDEQGLAGHRALAAILGVIVRLPPFKQALASKQMKSRYLERICDRERWRY